MAFWGELGTLPREASGTRRLAAHSPAELAREASAGSPVRKLQGWRQQFFFFLKHFMVLRS